MKAKISASLCALLLVTALGAGIGCNRGKNDAQISSEVQNKINSDSSIQSRQISVQSSGGIVTLSGFTNTDAERATAASDAAQVAGVKTVVNNLQVSAPEQAAAPAQQQPPAEEEPAPAPAPKPRTARSSAPRHHAHVPSTSSSESAAPSSASSSTPAAETPAPPPPPPPPQPVTVPSGTTISVRLIDTIDSERNQTGQTFRATLDSPLVDQSGTVVVPAGYDVTGRLVDVKSAGRFAGQSGIALELSELSVGGKSYALHTTQFTRQGSSRGKSTAKKVGAGAGIGALIGALAGGGKGAAIGATVGAGAGTGVSAATKGQQIVLPPETVLNFQLTGPISVIPTTQGPNAGRPRV